MARIYLEPIHISCKLCDPPFIVSNDHVRVYGAIGPQTVTLTSGATGLTVDQNIEAVALPQVSTEYTYKQAGNQVQIYLNDSLVANIPVQGDSDGTELAFSNGSANAILTNGVMTIGSGSSHTAADPTTGRIDPKLVIPPLTLPPIPPLTPPTPTPTDTTAPTLLASVPAYDATPAAVGANIVLTMSEAVTAVAGKNIIIKKTSDNSTVATIDAADAQVTGSGTSTITINPTADLDSSTEYYVQIDSGAFKDTANNDYTGISSTTVISFMTADVIAPTLTSSTPANDATDVATGANIVLTMSEIVTAVAGKNITIKKTIDDSTVTTIDVSDTQVSIEANMITINPTADLDSHTEYYVLIDSGAFVDLANEYVDLTSNEYAGITSAATLSFTTGVIDTTVPTLTSSTPAYDATAVAANANIVLVMSENVTAVAGKSITIKKTSDNSIIDTIDAADAQVTGSGTSTITINPTADLDYSTQYHLLIDSGAFKDSSNNDYAGISSATALSFTTIASPVVFLNTIAAGTGGFVINGEAAGDLSGYSVSSAGDVNGDGLADLIVGAHGNDTTATDAGRSYVVFGKSDSNVVSLATIATGTGGFAINGEAAFDYSGYSVSSAGDVNGDGLADLIVGAKSNSSAAGRSYVVFGKSDTNVVSLSSLGASGFAINGEAANDGSGYSVSSAGDVNGDGLADLIVGAHSNDTGGLNTGRSYVVFGKNSNTNAVSLSSLGAGGFAINGEAVNDYSGSSVSSAGDVNGDGLADLIVGAKYNSLAAGRSYVVFGKNNTTTVSLSSLGAGGFAINGEAAFDWSGYSVSSAGDVNGDGLADLIVGAKDNGSARGRSYVVFGKNDGGVVSLSTIAAGTGGFAINGEAADDYSGSSVSSAGDVNGDGLADLIVGAYQNDTGGIDVGRSYVVFGKSDGGVVSLATIATGAGGFPINGEAAGDYSGFSVSSAGDVNGDGLADLIVGALSNDTTGVDAGRSYVIFGGTQWLTTNVSGAGTVTGTAADEAIIGSSSSDTLTGGGGIDRFYAGDSNDVIVLTASDITKLADNTTGSPKAVINGGGDIDTIRLTGGANLNLTTIRNQGASGVEENSRIESIEKIDMATEAGANTLALTVSDVIDMSGMNLFNTGNGWTNGTYTLGASVSKHQIVVDGTAADYLIIDAGNGVWANVGNVVNGGNTYNVYDNVASNAQILVLAVVGVTNSDAV